MAKISKITPFVPKIFFLQSESLTEILKNHKNHSYNLRKSHFQAPQKHSSIIIKSLIY